MLVWPHHGQLLPMAAPKTGGHGSHSHASAECKRVLQAPAMASLFLGHPQHALHALPRQAVWYAQYVGAAEVVATAGTDWYLSQ